MANKQRSIRILFIIIVILSLIILGLIGIIVFGNSKEDSPKNKDKSANNKIVSIKDSVVNEAAEKFYSNHYGKREDIMLFYIAYSVSLDSEIQCIKFGSSSEKVVGSSFEKLFDLYDMYYQDDVGIQVSDALVDYANNYIDNTRIQPEQSFDENMIFDNLNWIDNTSKLQSTAKEFYDKTGIQFVTIVVDYDKLPGAK